MGQSLTSLDVVDTDKPGEKFLVLSYADSDKDTFISFAEESEEYDDDSMREILPRYCLTPDLHFSYCGRYLSPRLRTRYLMAHGPPCRSISFRKGSMINGDAPVPLEVAQYVIRGQRCRFVRDDFVYSDDDIVRCCTNPDAPRCPQVLRNGYLTPHCDAAMRTFCDADPGNALCLQWMGTRRRPALAAYSDICARDLDKRHCSEFVRVTRPDFYAYSDSSILRYCASHRGDKNCWCVAPPTTRVEALETFLGPRVCWVHECTDETTDRKFLLFDQDVQRQKCKYVGCSINIESLILENSTATLISDCLQTGLVGLSEDPGRHRARKNTALVAPSGPAIILVAAVLFYFLCVYARKRVNSRVINVCRRR